MQRGPSREAAGVSGPVCSAPLLTPSVPRFCSSFPSPFCLAARLEPDGCEVRTDVHSRGIRGAEGGSGQQAKGLSSEFATGGTGSSYEEGRLTYSSEVVWGGGDSRRFPPAGGNKIKAPDTNPRTRTDTRTRNTGTHARAHASKYMHTLRSPRAPDFLCHPCTDSD